MGLIFVEFYAQLTNREKGTASSNKTEKHVAHKKIHSLARLRAFFFVEEQTVSRGR